MEYEQKGGRALIKYGRHPVHALTFEIDVEQHRTHALATQLTALVSRLAGGRANTAQCQIVPCSGGFLLHNVAKTISRMRCHR